MARAEGAGVVGVNPLHALFPHNPAQASPYSPSSRMFLNSLYLDVEAIAEFARCAEGARACGRRASSRQRLAQLRAAPLVDYAGVAAAKLQVLELLYGQARRERARRRAVARTAFALQDGRRRGAAAARAVRGAAGAFLRAGPAVWGWPAWPEAVP